MRVVPRISDYQMTLIRPGIQQQYSGAFLNSGIRKKECGKYEQHLQGWNIAAGE